MSLNAAQKNALNSGNPAALALSAGVGDLVDQLLDGIASGQFGMTSQPWDVDNLAGEPYDAAGVLNANGSERHIAEDSDNHSGLTFGYFGGQLWVDGTGFVAVAQSTIALSASNTNYIEVDGAGAVSKNTTSFTAGRCPLFIVVTGSNTITRTMPAKALLRCPPTTGIPGSVMSTAMKTIRQEKYIGAVTATTKFKFKAPGAAATLTKVYLIVGTTLATDNTNYWTQTVVNKGHVDGSGTTDMLAASDANTTKTTGGAAFTQDVLRTFTLHGTGGNLIAAADDIIDFILTKAASATSLAGVTIGLEWTTAV